MSERAESSKKEGGPITEPNFLFPVFLKPERVRLLIIGGNAKAFEKLTAILNSVPTIHIKLISSLIEPEIKELAAIHPSLTLEERSFVSTDFDEINLIIATVAQLDLARQLRQFSIEKEKLIALTEWPDLSDFFLGAVIKKGQLKIAVSTNSKSPAIAQRLCEVFNATIPDEMDELLHNMERIRERLSGDVDKRVKVLNKVARGLVEAPDERLAEFVNETPEAAEIVETSVVVSKATRRSNWYLISIGIVLVIALSVLALFEFGVMGDVVDFLNQDNHLFYWMLLAGFLAEIVAGSMGMGYGVICTTTLLMMNIPPPVVSASIHSAESFTTAAGSISHWKLGNVNKKLTKALALPAIIGAILGAIGLSYFGEHYAKITKPFIATYTLYLGFNILRNALKRKERRIIKKKTNITTLGLVGGFIDSFGGGGWGPLVTGTFIKNGRTPRYVVGSSTVAKFILTVTSAITFLFTIGVQHWNIIVGLLLGGVITAPFSALLTSKLPVKKMFIIVGTLVIIMSLITIYRGIFR